MQTLLQTKTVKMQKVAEVGTRSAAEIAGGIIDSVLAFTSGGEQKDDVTLVVVKRTTERDHRGDEKRS